MNEIYSSIEKNYENENYEAIGRDAYRSCHSMLETLKTISSRINVEFETILLSVIRQARSRLDKEVSRLKNYVFDAKAENVFVKEDRKRGAGKVKPIKTFGWNLHQRSSSLDANEVKKRFEVIGGKGKQSPRQVSPKKLEESTTALPSVRTPRDFVSQNQVYAEFSKNLRYAATPEPLTERDRVTEYYEDMSRMIKETHGVPTESVYMLIRRKDTRIRPKYDSMKLIDKYMKRIENVIHRSNRTNAILSFLQSKSQVANEQGSPKALDTKRTPRMKKEKLSLGRLEDFHQLKNARGGNKISLGPLLSEETLDSSPKEKPKKMLVSPTSFLTASGSHHENQLVLKALDPTAASSIDGVQNGVSSNILSPKQFRLPLIQLPPMKKYNFHFDRKDSESVALRSKRSVGALTLESERQRGVEEAPSNIFSKVGNPKQKKGLMQGSAPQKNLCLGEKIQGESSINRKLLEEKSFNSDFLASPTNLLEIRHLRSSKV